MCNFTLTLVFGLVIAKTIREVVFKFVLAPSILTQRVLQTDNYLEFLYRIYEALLLAAVVAHPPRITLTLLLTQIIPNP